MLRRDFVLYRFGGIALVALLLTASINSAFASDCDSEKGAQVARKCIACHAFESDETKAAPSLRGVVGRQAAAHNNFKYSRSLRKLDIVWTAEELNKFLAAPQKYARGTAMAFAGLKNDQDRADLICYLQTLSPATK